MNYWAKRRASSVASKETLGFNALASTPTNIPHETVDYLKQLSIERGLPIARLIAYAIDNERGRENAFNFSIELPETEFKEYEYVHQAGQIMNFLQKFEFGTGVDTLALCRRDIGIPSFDLFMLAYRELLATGLIEEYKPANNEKHYKSKDYMRVRVVREDRMTTRKNAVKK